MAPRKRQQTRMDAAIDALVPLGFTKQQIRKKVKELLKVYGGDLGWPFIEEASYKLAIDVLLEEQENELVVKKIDFNENERAVDSSAAETSNPVTSPDLGTEQIEERIQDNIGLLPEDDIGLLPVEDEIGLLSVEEEIGLVPVEEEIGLPVEGDISLLPVEEEIGLLPVKEEIQNRESVSPISTCQEELRTLHNYETLSITSPADKERESKNDSLEVHTPVRDTLQCQKRKPCFGWISDGDDEEDEEDEDNFIFPVTVASLRREMTPNLSTTRRSRKRRWDVQPEEM